MQAETWDDSAISELIALKTQGLSYSEIAETMGRQKRAVATKYRKLFPVNPSQSKPHANWSSQETTFLSQVASKYPRALVYKYYNSLAKEYGMPIRSAIAVSHKLWSMGQETSANGFLTVRQTAIGLGFTQTKIIGFISDGLAVEKENKIYYIKQEDLIDFLIECPEKMIGIPESGFMWFMKVLKEVRECDRNTNNGVNKDGRL